MRCSYCGLPTPDGRAHNDGLTCIARLREALDAALAAQRSSPPAVQDGATRREVVEAAYRAAGWTAEPHEGDVTFSKASTVPPGDDEDKRPADWLEERRRKVRDSL